LQPLSVLVDRRSLLVEDLDDQDFVLVDGIDHVVDDAIGLRGLRGLFAVDVDIELGLRQIGDLLLAMAARPEHTRTFGSRPGPTRVHPTRHGLHQALADTHHPPGTTTD
jgi:hypothetical protein